MNASCFSFFIDRPISPTRRNESRRRASHSVATSSALSQSDSRSSEINFRKRCNSMPRIEQDSFETDDMELPLERASDNEYSEATGHQKNKKNRHNSDEQTKNQLCVHDKKQQQKLEKFNGNNVNEISLPPPCKLFF